MNSRPIVDPRSLVGLRRVHLPSICTIQTKTTSSNDYNEPIESWSNLANHTSIPCMVAADPGPKEVKTKDLTYITISHRIGLDGYYPTITESMRAVIGSDTYDIQLVRHDSQHSQTWLDAQILR